MSRPPELSLPRLKVVAGILADDAGRVLITDRRGASSMQTCWEFPGGKIRDGESAADALKRELDEELGVTVQAQRHLMQLEHDYAEFGVHIDFFTVTAWQGTPHSREGQNLRWVAPQELSDAALLPADRPVIDKLCETPA